MVGIIKVLSEKPAKIKYLFEQRGDASIAYAGISKPEQLLRYEAKVKIGERIKRFIQWYKYD